jgi:hypothetical protein
MVSRIAVALLAVAARGACQGKKRERGAGGAQARFGQDHGADARGEQHDHRRHDVGQDVLPQDSGQRGAG